MTGLLEGLFAPIRGPRTSVNSRSTRSFNINIERYNSGIYFVAISRYFIAKFEFEIDLDLDRAKVDSVSY